MRYIEMHCGPAASVLGPPQLEGGVNVCHVENLYESRDSHVRVPSNGVVEISLMPVCTGETPI